MDYTVVAKAIIDTINTAGEPLTEEQTMLLYGAIGGILIGINEIGLRKVIENISASNGRAI